jgi:hypothetical protein
MQPVLIKQKDLCVNVLRSSLVSYVKLKQPFVMQTLVLIMGLVYQLRIMDSYVCAHLNLLARCVKILPIFVTYSHVRVVVPAIKFQVDTYVSAFQGLQGETAVKVSMSASVILVRMKAFALTLLMALNACVPMDTLVNFVTSI